MKHLRAIQFEIRPVLVAVDSDTFNVQPIQVQPVIVQGDQIGGFAAEFAAQVAEQEAALNLT